MQTKLHQWAIADPGRRFDDLFNLVYDPAFLVVAWGRVRGNKGARTAGVDGVAPRSIRRAGRGASSPSCETISRPAGSSRCRVREKTIPKASGKLRRLGIPTAADRVVQAALKLVLEPIFEADFQPCSYGFRPKRRAQDAIAEIHYLGSPARNYEWVFEADIKACFDEIDHTALMGRVRRSDRGQARPGLGEGVPEGRDPHRGRASTGRRSPAHPRAGSSHRCWPTSPCPCSTSTSPQSWEALRPTRHARQATPRRAGRSMRLVRYADDFVVMVAGTRADAEALRDEVAAVLRADGPAPVGGEDAGSATSTRASTSWAGASSAAPSEAEPASASSTPTRPRRRSPPSWTRCERSPAETRHRTLADLLRRLNPVLRGWCNYFRHGVSKRDLRLPRLLRLAAGRRLAAANDTPRLNWSTPGPPPPSQWWQISDGGSTLFRPDDGRRQPLPLPGHTIPTPWTSDDNRSAATSGMNTWRAGCGESRTSGSEGGPGKRTGRKAGTAPRPDPYKTHRRSWTRRWPRASSTTSSATTRST